MKVIQLTIKKNEDKIFPYVWINGEEEEVTVKATIEGDGASLVICGIFLGNKSHKIVFNTEVTHVGKNTKSLTTLRAVFVDNAIFSNDGMVRIQKGAKNTDGYFQSKVLLFADAKGRSVPSLEIDENEVKAGHGSTIGRPDPQQLFYLRSRGLSEKEAEALLVTGFFEPIITLLPLVDQSSTKKRIESYLKNENI